MAFIFTCGTHTFQSLLAGSENVTGQCQNCGNMSAKIFKRWEWFTFCFLPVIPFSLKPYHEVGCHICNFYQDLKYRPDMQNGPGNQIPMQSTQHMGSQGQQQGYSQYPQYGPPPHQPYGIPPAK